MRRVILMILVAFLLLTGLAFAQGEGTPVTPLPWWANLLLSGGVLAVVVESLKRYAVPALKASAPWAIPLISMGLGVLASYVLQQFGVDISPIVDVFSEGVALGGVASALFGVAKGALKG